MSFAAGFRGLPSPYLIGRGRRVKRRVVICRKKVSRFGRKSNAATLSAAHKKAQGGCAAIRKIDAFGQADVTILQ